MNTSSVSRFNALRASVSNVVQLPLPIEGFPGTKNKVMEKEIMTKVGIICFQIRCRFLNL